MKVAFDSQAFNIQEYGGISRYICSLVKQLTEYKDVEAKIFAPLHINAYLECLPSKLVYGTRVPRVPKTGKLLNAVSQLMARSAINKYKPQIVHETYYSCIPSSSNVARTVVTVHDMIHERFPSIFPKNDLTAEFKKNSLKRADHIICVSESTKLDLLSHMKVPEEKISVVHNGFDRLSSKNVVSVNTQPFCIHPYLLYVGSRFGYKNFERLIRAYAGSSWLKNNFSLVCFGGGSLQKHELAIIKELKLSSRQIVHVYGGDDLLSVYYKNAVAFVYPSLYEGFGIPPLEAMSLGCPVICSNSSSIPEVVGNAAEFFDPNNIESIRAQIEFVLQSKQLRDCLVVKGHDRCEKFSWSNTTTETLDIYRRLTFG